MPFVQQIWQEAGRMSSRPVSHWFQMSPCSDLPVTCPCPLKLYGFKIFPCPLKHYYINLRQSRIVMKGQYNIKQRVQGQVSWMKVAWLPQPIGAQMYALNAGDASMIHLIDGQCDCVCCSWNLPKVFGADPQGCDVNDCFPIGIRMQWSPDGQCLAIAAWSWQPMLISFDVAAPDAVQMISHTWPGGHTERIAA